MWEEMSYICYDQPQTSHERLKEEYQQEEEPCFNIEELVYIYLGELDEAE